MTFYLTGIDYKNTPLEMREIIYRNREDICAYWRSVNPKNTAILITCNRIEIYGVLDNFEQLKHIQSHLNHPRAGITRNAYILYGEENVFKHGLRLACGLESQLRGEFQITQQLKRWVNKDCFPDELFQLWNTILIAARNIREISGLGANAVTISDAVFKSLAKRIDTNNVVNILVIGTGKVAELIAEKRPQWAHLAFVARKNRSKAERFAQLVNGEALLPDEIPNRLFNADAVISATSSPHYALGVGHFLKVVKIRKKPLYLYDLAMPRDVAPEVANIDFNVVFNLEKIINEFNYHNDWLSQRIKLATQLTEETLNEYYRTYENSYRVTAQ